MARPGDKGSCLEVGCNRYLPKPFTREQLSELLRSLRGEPLLSSITADRTLLPLIDEFVSELPKRIREVEGARAESDTKACTAALHALREEAGSIGAELADWIQDESGRIAIRNISTFNAWF